MKTLCSLLGETDVPLLDCMFGLADMRFLFQEILRSFISIGNEGLHYQSINKHHMYTPTQTQLG